MEQVCRIVLDQQLAGGQWRWRAESGQRGCTRLAPQGLRPGDRLDVAVRWSRAAWQVTRYVRIPAHAWMPAEPDDQQATVTIGGSAPVSAADDRVRAGDVRLARSNMNPRSTADRDAGRTSKVRPAVVAWVDPDGLHAGVHFLFDVDSAVRREGLARRIADWRAAGLRKPSVASAAEQVVRTSDLGALVGRLSAADRASLGLETRRP